MMLTIAMGMLAIGALFFIQTTFAAPIVNAATLLPLRAANAPLDFGGTIRILDYRVEPAPVHPGESIRTRFYWQALKNPEEQYWLLLQLVNTKGETVANQDGVPAAGRLTTDWWKQGDVFVSDHEFKFANDLPPGKYSLRLGLHPYDRWEWLFVRGQEMFSLGEIVVEAPLK